MKLIKRFRRRKQSIDMNHFLLVGLGNIGRQYFDTRHNIGFYIMDYIAQENQLEFNSSKLGFVAQWNFKGRKVFLLKPTTFMNRSGRSVNYWLKKKKIHLQNTLIMTDELQLPFGKIRVRAKGSSGGHNGLNSIEEYIGSKNYNRLRFGIGSKDPIGNKVAYVLGQWHDEEQKKIDVLLPQCFEMAKYFVLHGVSKTMNHFN
ncbi:MAG: aminoacyl-tRNA hydrolase [Flavobacteriaceae bacterium]|nr:aminoacyl-tRNA hydrolase [Flavobacteriaceae bacterium]MCY4254240.1 aminoacyl-tRNA hydrolase [Flavobacteriaceae bacterium]